MRIIDCAACVVAFAVFGCSAGASDPRESDATSSQSEALRFPRLCDGELHLACRKTEYCKAFAPHHCPGARVFGVCASEPDFCPDLFDPVCGCDGDTYPNGCFAAAAGAAVEHTGACAPKAPACGGIAGIPCPGFGKCVDNPNDGCDPKTGGADCGGLCTCIDTVDCVKDSHFDSDPNVCSCVPNTP